MQHVGQLGIEEVWATSGTLDRHGWRHIAPIPLNNDQLAVLVHVHQAGSDRLPVLHFHGLPHTTECSPVGCICRGLLHDHVCGFEPVRKCASVDIDDHTSLALSYVAFVRQALANKNYRPLL